MKRAISTFFKDPEPTSKLDDVEPGVNIVEGIVNVEEPLRSPVRGQNCVGYHYTSYLVSQSSRQPGPSLQKMREAEVYTSFDLEMEGGVLRVSPAKPGKFTREDHQELSKQYGPPYQATEDLILPGAKVRLRGKAKKVDGELVLKMSLISVIQKQAVAAGVVGDRKKRRKKKK